MFVRVVAGLLGGGGLAGQVAGHYTSRGASVSLLQKTQRLASQPFRKALYLGADGHREGFLL